MVSQVKNLSKEAFYCAEKAAPCLIDQHEIDALFRKRDGCLLFWGKVIKTIISKKIFCILARFYMLLQMSLRIKRRPYWTKLTSKIYLGAIPLKNKDHLQKLEKLGIKAVISINKAYEFRSNCLVKPVQGSDWNKKKISFMRISCRDMAPLTLAALSQAVDYIYNNVKQGRKVYIHCNAGLSRSATVAACSLMRLRGYTLSQAINHIRLKRPQIVLSKKQIASVALWHNALVN